MARLVRAGCSGLVLCALLMPAFTATEARAESLRISVFGDSVLLGAADDIASVLAGNDVSIDAHENVSLLGALSILEAARPAIGDVVVLDLGYNDGVDLGAWRDRIDRAMAILNGVPKVIWLSQAEFAGGRAEMNAELREAALRYPNLEVVDWNAIVAAHPDFVYGDGIHLTSAGRAGMAGVVRERVDAFVAARIAATSTTIATTTTSTTTTTTTTTLPRSQRRPRSDGNGGGGSGSDTLWIALAIVGGVVVLLAAAGARRRWGRSRRAG